jgi:hypothetical protein
MMRPVLFGVLAGTVVLALWSAALPVAAQEGARTPTGGNGPYYTRPHRRPRIEVNPGRLLYRRCEVQYVLQHRPSGTVLYPERYCWWVRG